MPATYEPIASTTLGADAATYTFSSIPGTFTDLRLILSLYATGDTESYARIRFNADSGTNYSRTRLSGTGSAAQSDRGSNEVGWYCVASPNSTLAFAQIDIMSYASTSVFKTGLFTEVNTQSGVGARYVMRQVQLWRNTSAITSVEIAAPTLIKSGSILSLYGIKAA